MNKVSVIIPFYNVENYFEQCLNSVVNQTLRDIEIILINDASTDGSSDIALKFAEKDERIKIINLEKQSGQGYARNRGIEAATGTYIGFVDSDDFIDPDMFENLYAEALLADTDITMCMARLFNDKTHEYYTEDYYSLKSLEKFGNSVFSVNDTKDEILDINVVLWNKIYNREFLVSSGVKFPEGYIYEDLPFFFETYIKAKRVNILWKAPYVYRQNRVFSTMQNSDKKVFDRIPMVKRTYRALQTLPFFDERKIDIVCWVIDDIFHRYTILDDIYYEQYYSDMKDFFSSVELTDEDKEKLQVSYCYEEFMNILSSSYYGFWKFLIEKYKTTNMLIKTVKHECNVSMHEMEAYLAEFRKKTEEDKIETEKFWLNEVNERVEAQKVSCENWWKEKMQEQQNNFLLQISDLKKNNITSVKKLCYSVRRKLADERAALLTDAKNKLEAAEYKFNKMKTEELKKQSTDLRTYYKRIIKNRELYHINAMKKQKDYYENKYLAVKIVMKICRKTEQFKNKFKRSFKIN